MKKLFVFSTLACAALVSSLFAQTYTFSTIPGALYNAGGIAVDSTGAIYTSSLYASYIVKTSPSGTELARYGTSYSNGSADGTGSAARFYNPQGLALDSAGNLYVADLGNATIRKVTSAGVVATLAGQPLSPGNADGTGSAARFNLPQAVAADSTGNVFVADSGNHTIRRITPAGVVTTFAGAAGIAGSTDATGTAARFTTPYGVAIDSAGNLTVADRNNHTIRRITPAGVVTTVAGLAGSHGRVDATGTLARFYYPQGVAVDSSGNIFVADSGNVVIRRIDSTGAVTTVGGLTGSSGESSGVGANARFYGPRAIVLGSGGDLYIGDSGSARLGVSSGQLAITVQPQAMTVGIGSTARLTVTATGAGPITYQWQKDGTPIPGATNSTLTLASVSSLTVGTYTVTATNPLGSQASTGAALAIVAAVPNDDFANATPLTGSTGTATGTNNGATGEPEEPTHHVPLAATSSIWYRWTAPETGTAVFSLSSNFSTAQVAWTGTALTNLTRAASTSGSRLTFRAVSGTTYYLAIGSNGTTRGNVTLSWRILLNDDFANAQMITGNTGTITGNNDGATREPAETTTYGFHNTSVWYRWTPSQSGTATFDLPSGLDAGFYTGTALNNLQGLSPWAAYNPLVNGVVVQRRVVNVQAGLNYWIAVGASSYYSGAFTMSWQITQDPVVIAVTGNRTVQPGTSITQGAMFVASFTPAYQWLRNGTAIAGATEASLTLNPVQIGDAGDYRLRIIGAGTSYDLAIGTLTVLIPPPNDNFANAAAMTGLTGRITGTNVNASGETSEPAHWNLSGTASSVWYRWTPTASGLAAIDTVGSTFDTVLAIYTGPATGSAALTNLSRLTQDDDRGGGRTSLVSFAATANTTYYIAVGGSTSGARGNLTLNWQLTPVVAITAQPVNQTVASGGSATFSVTASGSGLTYQWNRNGTAITGATNATLTVTATPGSASAVYTVTIASASGVSVTSDPAEFAVATPPLTTLTVRNARANGGGLLWSIASGNGMLVAVGGEGLILSSSDAGRTWVPRVSGTTNWIVGVTYGSPAGAGAGKFVAVADKGLILLSTDGITWTPATSSGTAQRMNSVLYADGKFVAVGEAGTILTSPDANIWTPRVSNVTSWLHGLAYNAAIGHFATTGQGGVILFSPDAVTWTRLPVAGLTADVEAVVAVDGYAQFVAIGHNSTAVGIHRDTVTLKTGESLTTWSGEATATGAKTATGTPVDFVGLAVGAGALYATGSGGAVFTATSDKGPWTQLTSGASDFLLAGLFVNDTLFIVGAKETVLQSDPIFTSRLRNISTRGQVGTGGDIMISGFIVRGDRPKSVLVRAAGPALAAFGVSGTIAAPVLTVLDSKATAIATNTGWSTAANAATVASTAARVSAFPFATGSADSALLATLSPGEYTVQVSGVNNATGICLVEVYDTDAIANGGSHAVNISTRGLSGAGASKMIAGFIIEGAAARRVLIRAVGPGLAQFGVAGTLAEPTLEVYNARGLLHASAGAWGLQPNADEIRGAFAAGGAFALAEGSKDSAMVIALPPGNWTVQVGGSPATAGATATTGVAIIEVYALP
ncbi:MAG: immunoglobulin domain-containing protein [Verrucomicrobia bacterium]|nr:immunoglobulin domain-containing protein [Verrucomicrobiota bacterium]